MSDLIWQLLIFYNSYKLSFWNISDERTILLMVASIFVFLLQIKTMVRTVVDVFYSDCANTVCSSCLQSPVWWSTNISTQELSSISPFLCQLYWLYLLLLKFFFFIRDYFLCIWKMISSYLFKINICCRYSFYPSFCFLIFSCLMFVTCFARNFLSFKVKKVSLNKAENSIRHFGELYTLHPWLFSECVH